MATLHLVNKPGQPLVHCQRALAPGDALILIEAGVYGLISAKTALAQCDYPLYALAVDLAARGLAPQEYSPSTPISYARLVELTVAYERVISWF